MGAEKGGLVFLGSPDFAVKSIEALIDADREIGLVITQPDRPKGRGRKLAPPPVKTAAEKAGIKVLQPLRLSSDDQAIEAIRELQPQYLIVVAYGEIIRRNILDIPTGGTINVHAGLLPQYRGAAPIERTIMAGDCKTGVTTIYLDDGIDDGDILLVKETDIGRNENAGALRERLSILGAELLLETLDKLDAGLITPRPQDESKAGYAAKITKEETTIDWTKPAAEIIRLIRALAPNYGARTVLPDGRGLKIYEAEYIEVEDQPGRIISCDAESLVVAAGDGGVRVDELQCAGKTRMDACSFVCGAGICAGDRLG